MSQDIVRLADAAPRSTTSPASYAHAWYTVLVLSLLYAVSWIDRNILVLLAEPVSQSLGLDDRQMALLLGLGFALLYAVGGLILGHFVDTRNRRVVASCGIVLWSVATILSAFANDFWTLLLLRCGVALGEAVLMPTAISLIADLFPHERRGLPVAAFTSVGSLMTIGSYAAGGAAISLAGSLAPGSEMEIWQISLVIVGLPGLALALLYALTAKVPPHQSSASKGASEVGMKAMWIHLNARRRFLGPLLSLTGINCIYSLAIAIWLPTVLIREHGLSASNAGYLIGAVGVPGALLGNFFWQWMSSRMQKRDPLRGVIRTFIVPALLVVPINAAGLLTHSLAVQLASFGIGMFLATGFNVLTPISVQYYVPAQMRARMVTVNFMIISVLGYGLGPTAAVEIGSLLSDGVDSLRLGLVAVALLTWPVMVVTTLIAVRNADGPQDQQPLANVAAPA